MPKKLFSPRFWVASGIVLAGLALSPFVIRQVTEPSSAFNASYEAMVRRYFGTPEAVAELTKLYGRVEREMNRSTYPTGIVPQSWMPERFAEEWGLYYSFESRVGVQYTADGQVVALWFEGSRNGCVITRRPVEIPAIFGRSFPLATEPVYVSGWVGPDLN
jgi:hypothetical protein